jgi:hypothetical protein
MGSTTIGNANPASMFGLAVPQNIKPQGIRINRDGYGRVRVGGRA